MSESTLLDGVSQMFKLNTKLVVLSALGIAILLNAWVSDDAFITFRVIEQLFAGNGPVWNLNERVQVYTHPLWFFLLSALRLIQSSSYLNSIFLGLIFSIGAAYLLIHGTNKIRSFAIGLILFCSNAWLDFTTSGLENSLSWFFLGILIFFTDKYLTKYNQNDLNKAFLAASLLTLTRHDLSLIIIPVCLPLIWIAYRQNGLREIRLGLFLLIAPLAIWTLFSLFYYGFPFPNTAYAKLNVDLPTRLFLLKGLGYLYDSLIRDPITLTTIFMGLYLLIRERTILSFSIACGTLLYLIYILRIGGDFMSGRFLTVPFYLSLFGLQRNWPTNLRIFISPLIFIFLTLFLPPLRLGTTFVAGVVNEKAHYWSGTSLLGCLRGTLNPPSDELCPFIFPKYEEGTISNAEPLKVIGVPGFFSPLNKIWIDQWALADPFLARLPTKPRSFRVGHIYRALPDGYLESINSGQNQIADPYLKEYYGHLSLITKGDLWGTDRIQTILKFNLGGFEHLLLKSSMSKDGTNKADSQNQKERRKEKASPALEAIKAKKACGWFRCIFWRPNEPVLTKKVL